MAKYNNPLPAPFNPKPFPVHETDEELDYLPELEVVEDWEPKEEMG